MALDRQVDSNRLSKGDWARMTIYLMEIVVILVLGVITGVSRGDAERRGFIILACLVLFALSGLRSYAVGVDTLQYWNAYLTAWMAHSWYETGFLYLLRALNAVSPNPQLLLLFTSAVMTACVGYVVYKSDCNPVLALFLYVTLLTYASFMNLMRQGIAAAIIIAAIPWLESGKRIRFRCGGHFRLPVSLDRHRHARAHSALGARTDKESHAGLWRRRVGFGPFP